MLLRLQPCEWSLLLVLLVQTLMVLVEAVPATRAPGGRRRSTTSTTSTASPTPPICVDPSTTAPPPPTEPPTTGPPTTSFAATNSTWPKQWVGPVVMPPTSAPKGVPPLGGAGGGNVRENLVEDDEDAVTCYTCVNVSDNIICNKYAIDVPCPKGEDFCHTLHIVDSRGQSVLVNKKCAVASECDPAVLGCLHIDTQTVCASCCDESYCNETVPTNRTASFYSSTRSRPTSASTPRPGPGIGRGASRSSSALTVAFWFAVVRAAC
ncbi:uncharacterized protein LOC113212619 [Frankliniella occidentalis]|uniref:Uncharacterized protein LOC113212619 n=1 Tax=Frankliniella occidentalis TaxID=133901 RepID=A0A9C6WRV3_FRAOC|nr:uncharacterized protein LOC113212619 [Frankliniella occidentalis]